MDTSNISDIQGVQTYESVQAEAAAAETGTQELGKDSFLRLLTVQLQNQNPLDPVDNTEFIGQLSQFSSLEQLTNANIKLENLAIGMSSVGSATMVSMIGKQVQAVGDGFSYSEGIKTLNFELESDVDRATITIYDEFGSVMLQKELGALEGGEQAFDWDGIETTGAQAQEGNYRFSIAANSGSDAIGVTTYTIGIVDQLDFSSGVAAPRIDGQTITVDKIVKILDSEAEG